MKQLIYFVALSFFTIAILGCSETEIQSQVDLTKSQSKKVNYASSESLISGEWSQWLGKNRNGISQSENINLDWETKAPTVVWKQDIGKGFSAFSIANGKAYTMYSVSNNEFVAAFDAATGKELWKFRTGNKFGDSMGGDGPRSTPTVENNVVYIYGAHAELYALNAENGSKIWENDLKETANAAVPTWGFCTSPLIEGNLLIVEAGGKPNKSIVAVDKNTGEIVWTSQEDKVGYSSPIAIDMHGQRQILNFTGTKLVSVTPDGKLLWSHPWITPYDVNAATPIFIAPDKVFISTEYDVGATLLQINSDMSVKPIWKNRNMRNQMATSIYHDGHIYGIDSKFLKCIDAFTGEDKWVKRGYGKGSLILVNDHLIVLGAQGNLGLIEANPSEYVEKGVVKVLNSGKCWTVPAIADGKLFIRNEYEALCLDIRQ